MDKVGTRLTRVKLIEAIIDPNAEVDKSTFQPRSARSTAK